MSTKRRITAAFLLAGCLFFVTNLAAVLVRDRPTATKTPSQTTMTTQTSSTTDVQRDVVTAPAKRSLPRFNPLISSGPVRIINRRLSDDMYVRWFEEDEPPMPAGWRPASLSEVKTSLPANVNAAIVEKNLRAMKKLKECFAESSVPKQGKAMVMLNFTCEGESCAFHDAALDASTMPPESDTPVVGCVTQVFGRTVMQRMGTDEAVASPLMLHGDVDQDEIYRLFIPEKTEAVPQN